MTETTKTPTKTNKAELIRTLLKDKNKTRAQIAQEVGCKVQYVFSVQNADRARVKKARAKRKLERQAELRNGAPKRKYTKSGKFAKTVPAPTTPMVELDRDQLKAEQAELHELNADFIRQLQEATKPRIQYIEVEVPQPFSHYTFWQRLRILFLGSAA
jgi:transcriptional regulator with XRE-family HTH domain